MPSTDTVTVEPGRRPSGFAADSPTHRPFEPFPARTFTWSRKLVRSSICTPAWRFPSWIVAFWAPTTAPAPITATITGGNRRRRTSDRTNAPGMARTDASFTGAGLRSSRPHPQQRDAGGRERPHLPPQRVDQRHDVQAPRYREDLP